MRNASIGMRKAALCHSFGWRAGGQGCQGEREWRVQGLVLSRCEIAAAFLLPDRLRGSNMMMQVERSGELLVSDVNGLRVRLAHHTPLGEMTSCKRNVNSECPAPKSP